MTTEIECWHMNCKFNNGFALKEKNKDLPHHYCTKDKIMVNRKSGEWRVAICSSKVEME